MNVGLFVATLLHCGTNESLCIDIIVHGVVVQLKTLNRRLGVDRLDTMLNTINIDY